MTSVPRRRRIARWVAYHLRHTLADRLAPLPPPPEAMTQVEFAEQIGQAVQYAVGERIAQRALREAIVAALRQRAG